MPTKHSKLVGTISLSAIRAGPIAQPDYKRYVMKIHWPVPCLHLPCPEAVLDAAFPAIDGIWYQ